MSGRDTPREAAQDGGRSRLAVLPAIKSDERLGLDFAYSLARRRELGVYFLQREVGLRVHPEAPAHQAALFRRQLVEQPVGDPLPQIAGRIADLHAEDQIQGSCDLAANFPEYRRGHALPFGR